MAKKNKQPPEAAPYDEPVWVFPYTGMSVGDSFFIPTMKPAYLTYVIDTTAKKAKISVKAYTTTEEGVLGVRAWRVA
jgi:hypothetical protein